VRDGLGHRVLRHPWVGSRSLHRPPRCPGHAAGRPCSAPPRSARRGGGTGGRRRRRLFPARRRGRCR
jgi:hypothetical protein